MLIEQDANLENSLAIKSTAKYLITIECESCLNELTEFLDLNPLKTLILSEGTNVVLPDYFDGVVISSSLSEISSISPSVIKVESAVNWNFFVQWCLENDMHGLENLALIPGSVGAAPIQNIGAYGVDLNQFVKSVRFYDLSDHAIKEFSNTECKFAYRNSIFKEMNVFILSVTFEFFDVKIQSNYQSILDYLHENNIEESTLTPKALAQIITTIRQNRLPNPLLTPNVGSFFKNPVVNTKIIRTEEFSLEDIVIWRIDDNHSKLAAARLIELIKSRIPINQNVELSNEHALVLINSNHATQEDILSYAESIQNIVLEVFNVELQIEPSIIYT